jgi:hypothetical protein
MSNHTLLTLGAFFILTTVLLNLFRNIGTVGDDVGNAQDMILATTISTSYLEYAQGLAFDQITDTLNVGASTGMLTPVNLLGPEGTEDSIRTFNDFDDFDGLVLVKGATGTNRLFTTRFRVSYVPVSDVDAISNTQTFMKRMDIETWRSAPPLPDGGIPDTLKMSIGMGYFHFD